MARAQEKPIRGIAPGRRAARLAFPLLALFSGCVVDPPGPPPLAGEPGAPSPDDPEPAELERLAEQIQGAPGDRKFAVADLLNHSHPEALARARRFLSGPSSGEIKEDLLAGIAYRHDERFLPDLLALLEEKDDRLRSAAAATLASLKSVDAIRRIGEAAREPGSSLARCQALVQVLGEAGDPEALSSLMALLQEGPPPLAPLIEESLRKITAHDFSGAPAWKKWWAAFKTLPDDGRLRELIERHRLRARQYEGQYRSLLEAYIALKKEKLLAAAQASDQALIDALSDDRELSAVRLLAVDEVRTRRVKEAVPALLKLLDAERAALRAAAAEALGEVGDPRGVPALRELVKDPDPSVFVSAAEALGRLKDSAALPAILKRSEEAAGLDVGRLERYLRAAGSLADGGSSEAISFFERMLIHPSPSIRLRIADLLGNLKAEGSVPALVRTLGDPDPKVVLFSVAALGNIGAPSAPEAGPRLHELAGHADASIREAVAVAMGKIGDDKAAEDISRLFIKDADEFVRKAAFASWEALNKKLDPAKAEALRIEYVDGLIKREKWVQAEEILVRMAANGARAAVRPRLSLVLSRQEKFLSALEAALGGAQDGAALRDSDLPNLVVGAALQDRARTEALVKPWLARNPKAGEEVRAAVEKDDRFLKKDKAFRAWVLELFSPPAAPGPEPGPEPGKDGEGAGKGNR